MPLISRVILFVLIFSVCWEQINTQYLSSYRDLISLHHFSNCQDIIHILYPNSFTRHWSFTWLDSWPGWRFHICFCPSQWRCNPWLPISCPSCQKKKDTIENVQCGKKRQKNVKINYAENSEMEEFSMSINPSKPLAPSFEPLTVVLQASGSLGWAAWHDI